MAERLLCDRAAGTDVDAAHVTGRAAPALYPPRSRRGIAPSASSPRRLDTQLYPSTDGDIIQASSVILPEETVALIGMRTETPADARPSLETRAHENIAYRDRGDVAHALVGRLDLALPLRLASMISG